MPRRSGLAARRVVALALSEALDHERAAGRGPGRLVRVAAARDSDLLFFGIEQLDAASASHRVGYESPSQFSREYRRVFGAPPLKDIAQMRPAA